MIQRDEVNIISITNDLRYTKPPKDVIEKLAAFAETVNSTPDVLENELRQMIYSPRYIPFHSVDDMYRAALQILKDQYKYKLRYIVQKNIEFYIIDKTSTRRYDTYRPILIDHPADLAKLKEQKKMNKERIASGKQPRNYRPFEIRKIPSGKEEKVTVICASVYGIFSRYGLFEYEKIGDVFGDKYKTNFGELLLENDDCRILDNLECGKCYKIDCNIFFADNHYILKLKDSDKPVLVDKQLPLIRDMICKLTNPIDVGSITDEDIGKYKVVRGFIKSSRTSVNKRDNNQGNITLKSIVYYNRSILNIVWWNDSFFAVKYGLESEVYVVCDLRSTEKYGISGIGHFIIPINIVPVASFVEEVHSGDW